MADPDEDKRLPPEFYVDYVDEAHIADFARIVHAPVEKKDKFISSKSDWRPVRQKLSKRKKRRPRKDETREGFVYSLLSWPFLCLALGWIGILGFFYFLTRFYIYTYEQWVTWRGQRNKLRKALRSAQNYEEWKVAATELDEYLGGDTWKESDEFSYYDFASLIKITSELRHLRDKAQTHDQDAVEQLSTLVRACVKNNFAGTENPRLYSETYYGTKTSLQQFIDELEQCLDVLYKTKDLTKEEKYQLFKGLSMNLGRAALCLSGGACFAYYHFGVIRAHLDAGLIPPIITGTSGGAVIAALVGTRTDEELKEILVPELADKITACEEGFFTWFVRWWRTGARFDSVHWAKASCWFTRGSLTFKEAYERTGRILNISCVPHDPNSPSILLNHITAPDCVIWTALLASAAVPGILNPVVLMSKTKKGNLIPYSFGHKWKDGSIRTDIPIQALNLHFNVNFPIVSQVNPHITIFYFSSRGTVGRPVAHRRGRGWRGGYLGSAVEQYLKLDLTKWLKVVRHLELLPRPLGTDWSTIFLQKFYGSVNILPKTKLLDYYYILSDPSRERMAQMMYSGEQATYPKLQYIGNRLKLERTIEDGRRNFRPKTMNLDTALSSDDIANLIKKKKQKSARPSPPIVEVENDLMEEKPDDERAGRFSPMNWFNSSNWPAFSDVLSNQKDEGRRWSFAPRPSLRRTDSGPNGDSAIASEAATPREEEHSMFNELDNGHDIPSSTTWTEEDSGADEYSSEGDDRNDELATQFHNEMNMNGHGFEELETPVVPKSYQSENFGRRRKAFELGSDDNEESTADEADGQPGQVDFIQAGPS